MTTFVQAATGLLQNLCHGLGLAKDYGEFQAVQDFLLQDWGGEEIPARAPYPSMIGDDHSPFEYSVAFGAEQTELRILVEIQAKAPGAVANQRAALDLNRRLSGQFGANFQRFDAITDLFLPQLPGPPFSLWHAVCLGSQNRNEFKVYLNPQVRGPARANGLVAEAFDRLGLSGPREIVEAVTSPRLGGGLLNYFSLDLSEARGARVKVYFQHVDASVPQLEKILGLSPSHRVGDVTEFCRAVVGSDGPYQKKPVTSCFSFVEGLDQPTAATLHFPIAHYVPNDLVTVERVAKYLESQGIDAAAYVRTMHAFAMRPLHEAAGIQSYASYRRQASGIRFTAYLSPELFRVQTQHASQHRLKAASVAPEPVPNSARQ
jgi:DMATS type aromatic prenyltransferase